MIHRPDISSSLWLAVLQKIQDKYEYSIFPLPTIKIFPKNPIFLYLSDRPFPLCRRSPYSGFFFVFAISIHIRIHIHILPFALHPANISTAIYYNTVHIISKIITNLNFDLHTSHTPTHTNI